MSDHVLTACSHTEHTRRYTTRVIRNELNPAWEETAFVPIRPGRHALPWCLSAAADVHLADALRDGEDIKLEIWDSDRFTADESVL